METTLQKGIKFTFPEKVNGKVGWVLWAPNGRGMLCDDYAGKEEGALQAAEKELKKLLEKGEADILRRNYGI